MRHPAAILLFLAAFAPGFVLAQTGYPGYDATIAEGRAFLASGEMAFREGRWTDAERAFRRAVIALPESARVWDWLGRALYRTGEYADSEASVRRAIDLAPRVPTFYDHLGMALLARDRPADAVAAWFSALAIDPSYVEARYNLATAYEQQKRYRLAEMQLRRAARDAPRSGRIRYALAVVLRQDGRPDEARRQLDTLLVADPASADGWTERGFACIDGGDPVAAESDFRHALAINRENARARYGLGVALVRRREYVAAQRQCDSLSTADTQLARDLQRLITGY